MRRSQRSLIIHGAAVNDINTIYRLLSFYAEKRLLLQRTREDIKDHLSEFHIAVQDGKTVGCYALHDFGNNLYEIRSLAVAPEYVNLGIGTALIKSAIAKLKDPDQGCRLFALTYRPALFIKLGFRPVTKDLFPEKIWSDCVNCSKQNDCDENAVLMEI